MKLPTPEQPERWFLRVIACTLPVHALFVAHGFMVGRPPDVFALILTAIALLCVYWLATTPRHSAREDPAREAPP